MSDALWITWHDHARTRGLAPLLGLPVHVREGRGTLSRHLGGLCWALGLLRRHRPRIVFLHVSYLLLLACALYKMGSPRGRVVLVGDCHNKVLLRSMPGAAGAAFRRVKGWLFARLDLLVVSNEGLRPQASALAPRVAALRDALPRWPEAAGPAAAAGEPPRILFVCSFDRDEPIDLIFAAALEITAALAVEVVITGDAGRAAVPAAVAAEPRIRLPGFVPGVEYRRLLTGAAVVVVLTGDEDCLVCGGYEAVGAMRPLVLSRTRALQDCFGAAAVYAEHDPQAVREAVAAALAGADDQARAAARRSFLEGFRAEWRAFADELARLLPAGSAWFPPAEAGGDRDERGGSR